MQVDFYQLANMPVESVVLQVTVKVMESGERLVIVAEDEQLLNVLDTALWTHDPTSFLAHGYADDDKAADQPILLSTTQTAANGAQFIILADGIWRESLRGFSRIFYLFDADHVHEARQAWRILAVKPGVEPRYWKQENGRWRQGP